MNQAIYYSLTTIEIDALLDKDIWLASDIGLKPDSIHGIYNLSFTKISTPWLKQAAKKFVRLQATTRSFATCRGYLRAFNHFDDFLQNQQKPFPANKISRAVIVNFIQHLFQKKLGPMTRAITLINLRVFHEVVLQENWLPWPERPIIFKHDLPKDVTKTPKFIPEDILTQLKKHLHNLPDWMQQFVIILMETGRRVSEICLLEQNCLEKDTDGDFLLRVYEKKLKRIRLIPISNVCVEAVKKQQLYLKNEHIHSPLLFPAKTKSKSPTINACNLNRALKQLAEDKKILDCNGSIWKFSSHQFRHTLGTQMINSGMPQVMVQHYLGHESPEMTARYAHIHNETMKAAFMDYQEKLVNIHGNQQSSQDHLDARWLKKNIMTQSLPNGLCSLPLTQNKCPHANACLTCGHFRTSKRYLEQHKSQLEETCKVINNAKKNGWQRVVEMNTEVACNLESIINTLENTND